LNYVTACVLLDRENGLSRESKTVVFQDFDLAGTVAEISSLIFQLLFD
jgi:hypothetical protein